MRKIPPLNALKSFEATARNGSFHGAADELCVSVSAISHQIKQLESYLNMELFHRHVRSIELTEVGKKYYPVLRDAFERISDGTVALLKPQDSNNITIQLYSTIAIRWLIPKLPDFQQKHPEINVRLHTSHADVDFEHSDVDACIKIGGKVETELDHHYLFTSELFPVCSPNLLKNKPEIKQRENFKEAKILQVHPSKYDWQIWLKSADLKDADPDAGLQFDSYDHAITTAMQGLGVAMGMQPYVKNELDSGLLVELFPELRTKHVASWYFVCRKEKSHLKKITLFKDWLIDQINSDTELSALRN
jgi:LysR family glycine cleavage system transcriptional activator